MCSKLQELDFSNNSIEDVPIGLAMCTALNLLHLGTNKISMVPPEVFCMLTNMKELQLYKNKITVIPPEIGNMVNIRRLSLSSNNLKTLPDEIGACTSLRELYINNNAKFSMLPGAAGHLRYICLNDV
jgi:Leucine-rich repeat (LRR) protein